MNSKLKLLFCSSMVVGSTLVVPVVLTSCSTAPSPSALKFESAKITTTTSGTQGGINAAAPTSDILTYNFTNGNVQNRENSSGKIEGPQAFDKTKPESQWNHFQFIFADTVAKNIFAYVTRYVDYMRPFVKINNKSEDITGFDSLLKSDENRELLVGLTTPLGVGKNTWRLGIRSFEFTNDFDETKFKNHFQYKDGSENNNPAPKPTNPSPESNKEPHREIVKLSNISIKFGFWKSTGGTNLTWANSLSDIQNASTSIWSNYKYLEGSKVGQSVKPSKHEYTLALSDMYFQLEEGQHEINKKKYPNGVPSYFHGYVGESTDGSKTNEDKKTSTVFTLKEIKKPTTPTLPKTLQTNTNNGLTDTNPYVYTKQIIDGLDKVLTIVRKSKNLEAEKIQEKVKKEIFVNGKNGTRKPWVQSLLKVIKTTTSGTPTN